MTVTALEAPEDVRKLGQLAETAVDPVEADVALIPGQRVDEFDAVNPTAPAGVVKASVFDKTPSEPVKRGSSSRYFRPGIGWVDGDGNSIEEPKSMLNPASRTATAEVVPVAEEKTQGPSLGYQLRVEGVVDEDAHARLFGAASNLRQEIEDPAGKAWEDAYAAVLTNRGIGASDEIPPAVHAEAVKAAGRAKAAVQVGLKPLPEIDRSKGTTYVSGSGVSVEAPQDSDAGVSEGADQSRGEAVTDPTSETAVETGFKPWAKRRLSDAMRLAKWAYDQATNPPTKKELTNTAQVGAVAALALAGQVRHDVRQLWHGELKPELQVLVHNAIGKACMYLYGSAEAGRELQSDWRNVVIHYANLNKQRDEQALAAEAARVQAFHEQAAKSQAEWVQANQPK